MTATVAVIEDDRSIAQMYQFKLEQRKLMVKCAYDGEQGLELVRDLKPDILLLDIRMPKMSGDEMLRKLRAEEWGKNIRVIILTNISRDEAPPVLRFLHVDRYVVKAHHTPSQIADIVMDVLK